MACPVGSSYKTSALTIGYICDRFEVDCSTSDSICAAPALLVFIYIIYLIGNWRRRRLMDLTAPG